MRAAKNRAKLTAESVAKATLGKITWDAEIPGFGLDVNPKGDRRKFIYRYNGTGGKQREIIIGYHYQMAAESARTEVKKIIGQVIAGGDPYLDRKMGKVKGMLFEQIVEDYASWSKANMKPTSIEQLNYAIVHIKKKFGDIPIGQLTRGYVQTQYDDWKDKTTYTSKIIAWAGAAWTWADQREKVPDVRNPFQIQFVTRKKARKRILSRAEIKRVWQSLDELFLSRAYDHMSVFALEMLLITPLRKTEAFRLRWSNLVDEHDKPSHLDTATHMLVVDHKTDQSEDHIRLVVTKAVRDLLTRIPRTPKEWVFPSPNSISGHIEGVDRTWAAVRQRAGLKNINIHDLRRSWNSVGATLGYDPATMGKTVGNSAKVNAAHYWHLEEGIRAKVSNDVAEAIVGLRDDCNDHPR